MFRAYSPVLSPKSPSQTLSSFLFSSPCVVIGSFCPVPPLPRPVVLTVFPHRILGCLFPGVTCLLFVVVIFPRCLSGSIWFSVCRFLLRLAPFSFPFLVPKCLGVSLDVICCGCCILLLSLRRPKVVSFYSFRLSPACFSCSFSQCLSPIALFSILPNCAYFPYLFRRYGPCPVFCITVFSSFHVSLSLFR